MSGSDSNIIIVTGPESTGKTSLVERLNAELGGFVIPEYARDYILQLQRAYNYSDIEFIAKKQQEKLRIAEERDSDKNIFVDTYLLITKIWFKWHAGKYPHWIDDEISKTRNVLYLLCSPDIEWQADDVRENGGEARLKLFEEYKNELNRFNLNYKIISGQGEERFLRALSFSKEYIMHK